MPNPDDDVARRPFADFLREQSKGSTHDELTERLFELVRAVTATGKGGTLTLTIGIDPLKDAVDVLKVTDKVTLKLPAFPRKASIFFADDGNLVRDNPNQLSFQGMRDVSDPEPREPDVRERAAGEDK